MKNNTALDDLSRDTPGASDEEVNAKRTATMVKVNDRLAEVAERIVAIEAAVQLTLTDLIAKHPLGEACDTISRFDAAVGKLEDATSSIKKRVAYAKEVSMVERMDNEECTTFNTEDHRVTRTSKAFASIIGDMQDKAYTWLRKQGYGALIKETVNASSLSAAAKELMNEGKELPDTMFTSFFKDGISITRKKKA